jgi:hypothetical protein
MSIQNNWSGKINATHAHQHRRNYRFEQKAESPSFSDFSGIPGLFRTYGTGMWFLGSELPTFDPDGVS